MTVRRQPPEVSTTWVVVADRGCARIFATNTENSALTEVESLINPEGRMKQSECVSDQKGHIIGHGGMPVAAEPKTEFATKTAEPFAAEIVDHLESGRNAQKFGRVILIAAPKFLGILRSKIAAPLSRLVDIEIDKDYTSCTPAELAAHLNSNKT